MTSPSPIVKVKGSSTLVFESKIVPSRSLPVYKTYDKKLMNVLSNICIIIK